MNKKEPFIVALDMDGTLLNSKKRISLKTLFYLRKLSKMGGKIVLCSGRPSRSIIEYYNQLKLDTPIVCYNGAYAFSPKDKNFKPQIMSYPKEDVIKLVEKMKGNILNMMCETDDEIWIDKEDKYLDRFFWYKNMKIHVGEFKKILTKDPMTCIFHVTQEYKDSKEVDKFVKQYKGIGVSYWSGSPYFELHHVGVTKGSMLKYIASYYKIPAENVIAIGDAYNDLEMFEFAKTSILMKNTKTDISKVTMISEKDNDHNGIYYALKKIIQ